MLVWLLVGSFFVLMLLRKALPFGVKAQGKETASVSLTFGERMLMHRMDMYALAFLMLLSAIGQWFPLVVELLILMVALGIVNLPMRYHFTSSGFAYNNVVFRRWKEFDYIRVHGSHITLMPRNGFAPLKLIIKPSRHAQVLPYFQRYLATRYEKPTPWYRRLHFPLWIKKRLPALLLGTVLIFGAMVVLSACGESDASGLNTSNPSNLTSVYTSPSGSAVSSKDQTAAQKAEPYAFELATQVDQNRVAINFVWTLVTGYLVMFMQAGFALVETGLCRAKNAGHTMAMNFMIYGLGMLGYYICGFAFQNGGVGIAGVGNLGGLASLNREWIVTIGGNHWGLLGLKGFFLTDGTYDVGVAVMFLFQMVFMDTTATIPTGAMAERWKWSAFCVFGFFISTLVYPVFANWAWGGGWLSQLGQIGLGKGYIDFAGSGVVHAVGGWCALAGALVLGPRLGKFNKDGSPNTIPGHNMVLALLGCFILAFGWFGFNPGSTLGASGNGALRIGIVAVDTMLAGACGSVSAMCYTWLTGAKKPDIGMMGNGLLAGLVAITAPSGYVSPVFACVIGLVAGVLVVVAAGFVERVLKVDDPVGAIAVHGFNGAWGQLSVGLFADGLANYGGLSVRGIFFGDPGQLVAQLIGMAVCFVYVFGMSWIFFKLYHLLFGLRVSAATELKGLDIPEMGSLGYNPDAEFYTPDDSDLAIASVTTD
jgi:Amt family ammonium transporter